MQNPMPSSTDDANDPLLWRANPPPSSSSCSPPSIPPLLHHQQRHLQRLHGLLPHQLQQPHSIPHIGAMSHLGARQCTAPSPPTGLPPYEASETLLSRRSVGRLRSILKYFFNEATGSLPTKPQVSTKVKGIRSTCLDAASPRRIHVFSPGGENMVLISSGKHPLYCLHFFNWLRRWSVLKPDFLWFFNVL
jgi:hypothetical protein